MSESAPFPVIITDLDGTLLDHETYSYEAAARALAEIILRGIPLIFNSSKTRSEIEDLRERLQNDHPFVVENGAAVYSPMAYFEGGGEVEGDYEVRRFGAPRDEILEAVHRLREEGGLNVEGFADWTAEQIAERTGLSVEEARRAGDRCCSEPLLFSDSPERLRWFQERLDGVGLRTVQGGRFLHVMGRFDKADGVRWIRERFEVITGEAPVVVIALGDSPNDQGMLDAADVAVIVRSSRSDSVSVSKSRRTLRTSAAGPAGWQEAMDQLLPEFR